MSSVPPHGDAGGDGRRHPPSRRPRAAAVGRGRGGGAPPGASTRTTAPGGTTFLNEDPRRSLLRATRYQASAQIRKRRREEVLLEKRRGFLPTGGMAATITAGPVVGPSEVDGTVQDDDAAVQRLLEEFVSRDDAPSAARLSALFAHGDRAVAVLQRWLEREREHQRQQQQQHQPLGSACDRFLEKLRSMIIAAPMLSPAQTSNDGDRERGRAMALSLLEALVATTTPAAPATTPASPDDAEGSYYDYYSGTNPMPVGWSHEIARQGNAWVPALVAVLPTYPHAVGSILSHLYQDESQTLVVVSSASSGMTTTTIRSLLIPQYWPNIVAALSMVPCVSVGGISNHVVHPPEVARLGSVILQNDSTTPGMDFLGGYGGTHSNSGGVTSGMLAELLHDPATAASAAWMLEGLTRREDAAVEHLCRDAALVGAILSALNLYANVVTVSPPLPGQSTGGLDRDAAVRILLPTLRTIGNMVTACDGRFLVLFDKVLVDCLGGLFPCVPTLREEILWVMGCCLVDVGRAHQVATTTLAPLWIPILVAVLEEAWSTSAVRFEIKRQALASLWIALAMPPDVETFEERASIQGNLDAILLQHVGNTHGAVANLVSTLVQLMGVADHETVLSALRVLQRLALVGASDADALRSRHVLDRLEEVLEQRGATPAGDLASNLLEILQEDDDEEELDDINEMRFGPTISDGSYAFGLPSGFAPGPTASSTSHAPAALGRGRGRPIPSWMEQKN